MKKRVYIPVSYSGKPDFENIRTRYRDAAEISEGKPFRGYVVTERRNKKPRLTRAGAPIERIPNS